MKYRDWDVYLLNKKFLNPFESIFKDLVKKCIEGDQDAYKGVFELYYGYVMTICLQYGKNREEAEEMSNDTFYTLFKYMHRYDDRYEFKPWLRRLCINCCLKYNKKYTAKIDSENIEVTNLSFGYDPINSIELENDQQRFLLGQLPPRYRLVFNMHVFENYSHSEIANYLGISIGTSKSNLSRAKSILKRIMLCQK